jgi:hypothetical protein
MARLVPVLLAGVVTTLMELALILFQSMNAAKIDCGRVGLIAIRIGEGQGNHGVCYSTSIAQSICVYIC